MGFLGDFFKVINGSINNDNGMAAFDATPDRGMLKQQLSLNLRQCGFSEMEVKEVIDVIELAEADIQIAEDSLRHVNINNPDPTRAMHAALEDIRRYQKELAYNVRKKIFDIMARKQSMNR